MLRVGWWSGGVFGGLRVSMAQWSEDRHDFKGVNVGSSDAFTSMHNNLTLAPRA